MTDIPTVEELHALGYKVSITHWRYVEGEDSPVPFPRHQRVRRGFWGRLLGRFTPRPVRPAVEPRGGVTWAAIADPVGKQSWGTALCNPSDNYCKRTGRALAIARALGLEVE